MSTQSDSASTVGAQPDASGSSKSCSSPPSAADPSLTAALLALVQQLSETNVHLLMLADQTVKCLAHMSLLLDLLMNEDQDEESSAPTYLDGKPIL